MRRKLVPAQRRASQPLVRYLIRYAYQTRLHSTR
jgi:hypothetical protein